MRNKINDKKTNRPKKTEKKIEELTFIERIALLSDCTPQYVGQVLGHKRPQDSDLAQRILINAERVRQNDNNLLLQAVKKAVPFGDSKMYIEQ